MSEVEGGSPPATNEPEASEPKGPRRGLCCLALIGVPLLAWGALERSAGNQLDARFEQAAKEVALAQQEHVGARETLWGPTEDTENAAADYRGLDYLFYGGKLPTWVRGGSLPDDVESVLTEVEPIGAREDWYLTALLLEEALDPLHQTGPRVSPGAKDRERGLDLYRRYAPALRYLRAGVRRGVCDWEIPYEDGILVQSGVVYTNLRNATNLLAHEALQEEPRAAIDTGLVIVACGRDFGRHGTLIGDVICVMLQALGYRSLAHTLGRKGVTSEDLSYLRAALDRVESPDLVRTFERARQAFVVTLLSESGRLLSERDLGAKIGKGPEWLRTDLVYARELAGLDAFYERAIAAAKLGAKERSERLIEIDTELDRVPYLTREEASPNFLATARNVVMGKGLLRCLKAIVVAHQIRLETGAFPALVGPLEEALGDELKDPTANSGGPLNLRATKDSIVVWIANDDGVDNGGPDRAGDDVGLWSRLEAAK